MKNTKSLIVLVSLALILLVGFLVKSKFKNRANATNTAVVYEQKEETMGTVTVTAKPLDLSVGEKPKFEIAFNTHSVDLTFDVATISSLVDDRGESFGEAVWEGSAVGGHHRNGILTFSKQIKNSVTSIKLMFKGIDSKESSFSWKVN